MGSRWPAAQPERGLERHPQRGGLLAMEYGNGSQPARALLQGGFVGKAGLQTGATRGVRFRPAGGRGPAADRYGDAPGGAEGGGPDRRNRRRFGERRGDARRARIGRQEV